jgi:hypothetical protein
LQCHEKNVREIKEKENAGRAGSTKIVRPGPYPLLSLAAYPRVVR